MSKIKIYNQIDFEKMRRVGKISASILDQLHEFIKPGITTEDVNNFVHQKTIENKCIPAPLNYHGFPKSVCTSINDVICHGIPDKTILKDGDIINVDVTSCLEGYYGDTSRMYCVGEGFKEEGKYLVPKKLVKTTFECLMKGISTVKAGARLFDIARVIQFHAENNGFSVVRDFCGHGIGTKFHEKPDVLHYVPSEDFARKHDVILKPGMIFTIEPMINEKSYHSKVDKKDNWTARTVDGGLSAQFEHTIGVTKQGCEIFTLSKKNFDLW